MVWLPIAFANPLDGVPYPDDAKDGALCTATARFDGGEMASLRVGPDCPRPFRSAIDDHYETHPIRIPFPPDTMELRIVFQPSERVATTRPAFDDVGDRERPASGTRMWIPERYARFKSTKWPEHPTEMRQPVTCRANVQFGVEGIYASSTISGCPTALATRTRTALESWTIDPVLFGATVPLSTRLRFTYVPARARVEDARKTAK